MSAGLQADAMGEAAVGARAVAPGMPEAEIRAVLRREDATIEALDRVAGIRAVPRPVVVTIAADRTAGIRAVLRRAGATILAAVRMAVIRAAPDRAHATIVAGTLAVPQPVGRTIAEDRTLHAALAVVTIAASVHAVRRPVGATRVA